jgi:hypothetical protein
MRRSSQLFLQVCAARFRLGFLYRPVSEARELRSCRLMHCSKVRILVAQMLRIGFALRELSADPANAS